MHLPSHPQHDADLADDDVYPWADHARDECDWCGKTSCFCAVHAQCLDCNSCAPHRCECVLAEGHTDDQEAA